MKASKLGLLGYGRRNGTVYAAQIETATTQAAGKQPGRRYGPPPKNTPKVARGRTSHRRRRGNYLRQNGGDWYTARQLRQLYRMDRRASARRSAASEVSDA